MNLRINIGTVWRGVENNLSSPFIYTDLNKVGTGYTSLDIEEKSFDIYFASLN